MIRIYLKDDTHASELAGAASSSTLHKPVPYRAARDPKAQRGKVFQPRSGRANRARAAP
jgi:hypothetical protein